MLNPDPVGDGVDDSLEAVDRALKRGELHPLGVANPRPRWIVLTTAGRQGRGRKGEEDKPERAQMFVFREQARDRR